MGSTLFRRIQLRAMTSMFARALSVPAPSVPRDADEALRVFAQFSASAATQALADAPDGGAALRTRLGGFAFELGRMVGRAPVLRRLPAEELLRALYRNIGIDLQAPRLPGQVCMGPCFFASCYEPGVCQFMSAFDQGAMRGVLAAHGHDALALRLTFDTRITQGAPVCRAHLG